VSKDNTQPFFVGANNERFPHRSIDGYLAALESLSTKETPIVNIEEEPWTKRQWDTVQQLRAQVLFLSDKVNEMRANASKRKTNRYKEYTT